MLVIEFDALMIIIADKVNQNEIVDSSKRYDEKGKGEYGTLSPESQIVHSVKV